MNMSQLRLSFCSILMQFPLLRLYKALDKNDIVSGILREKIEEHVTESLKNGLAFEQVGDWKNACKEYEKEIIQLLHSNTRSFEEHFIFDAYLKVRY